jgi:hypothetical protein
MQRAVIPAVNGPVIVEDSPLVEPVRKIELRIGGGGQGQGRHCWLTPTQALELSMVLQRAVAERLGDLTLVQT